MNISARLGILCLLSASINCPGGGSTPVGQVWLALISIVMRMIVAMMMLMMGMMATTLIPMATGVWEDNDPSLSVQCAEGRPRALPRVEVDQVEYVIMIIIVLVIN